MRNMPDSFSNNAAVLRIVRAVRERLALSGPKRAAGTTVPDQGDDQAEAVLHLLDSGAFDLDIAEVISSVPFAQPVAFNDLKEADTED